jgi:hypothetical protein
MMQTIICIFYSHTRAPEREKPQLKGGAPPSAAAAAHLGTSELCRQG